MHYLLGLQAESISDRLDGRLKGVGMIRSEYLCRSIGEYFPLESCRSYVSSYVDNVCQIFEGDNVWYRTSELTVPEVNALRGADGLREEKHYVMGTRGVRRGLAHPSTFKLELTEIARLSLSHNNLHCLFPFVSNPNELEACVALLNEVGFTNRFGMMAEIPSAIIMLDAFLDLGPSAVTIGVNDLTSFALGAYRESRYHDCTHPAVIRLIEHTVDRCHTRGVEVNVAGRVNGELMRISQDIGVDGFVVNYPLLPEVLGVSHDVLLWLTQLDEIKARSKRKIRV